MAARRTLGRDLADRSHLVSSAAGLTRMSRLAGPLSRQAVEEHNHAMMLVQNLATGTPRATGGAL